MGSSPPVVDEGVERTASAKMSADVVDGVGVAAGGTGADGAGAEVTTAGADEEGLKSGAGTVADLA